MRDLCALSARVWVYVYERECMRTRDSDSCRAMRCDPINYLVMVMTCRVVGLVTVLSSGEVDTCRKYKRNGLFALDIGLETLLLVCTCMYEL